MSTESTIPTPATPDVCTVALLIDGREISGALQVASVSVTRELNRISAAGIQIQDGEAAKATFPVSNTDQFLPGKKVEFSSAIVRRTTPCSRD